MDDIYQIHNLYKHVAVISARDSVGAYIDRELEVFRSHDSAADFCIQVYPLSRLDGELHRMSELQGIEYSVHTSTHKSYVGYRGAYWRFDELGDSVMHVFYSSEASAGVVWTIVEQWIKVALLQRKWMAVHSCAFVYEDVPVIIAAWQGLGKSVLLHHALADGASYVSDDFTLISSSGEMRGYPPALVNVHDGILRPYATKGECGSRYPSSMDIMRSIYTIAARIGLGSAVKAVARCMGYGGTPVRVIRVDTLNPGAKVVLRTSEVLWIILLPTRNGSQERCTDVPISEAVERVVAGTMTDYYFTVYYDRFLYQVGQRATNDHLILDARKMYRDILVSALEHAQDIWMVDSLKALFNPDDLLKHIRVSCKKVVD